MRGFWRSLCCGLVISLLACGVVLGQGSTAQISGTVRDQSGAVLPGVEITATQTETGVSRNTISNETGSYVLPNLATGPYRLEAALAGFRTFVQTGIVLQVNANPTVNVILEVGQLTEQVEVQANASLVETRSVGVGQVIENERILELPLNGRQVTDLIVLAGSAVNAGNASSRSMNGGVGISVAGGLSSGVAYVLDGAMHNDPSNNLNMPLPFPDALQEFKVETSGLTAQNGMHSAAAVNSVTKSGTNELHGDLFEFVRNGTFNARNAFAPKRDTLKRNQFGGTVGGPIKKNKLFFFGGYQGTITRSDPPETIRFVPTARMLAGDFTAIASTACRANAVALSAPFVGNRVDPAQFSRAALFVAGKLPKPEDECGTVRYGIAERPNESQIIGKIDYQHTDTDSWFGRSMITTFRRQPPLAFTNNVLVSTTGGRDNLAQAYTLGNTHLIGSNIVNSLRLAVNRTAVARTHKEYFSAQDAGIPIFSCLKGNMMVGVTNGFTIGGGTENNSTFRTTTYQVGNDLSIIRGSHQMAVGASLAHWRLNFNANVRCNGQFSFDGSQTSPSGAIGLADFLLGKTSQLIQAEPNVLYMREWYFGAYGQDTWKVNNRLTLNYGLRWEPFFPQDIINEHVYAFSEQGFRGGTHSSVFPKAPAGYTFPGDTGFPGRSGIQNRWVSFGPRLGLAWDVSGDGRTSVRASYAMSYDFPVGEFHLNTSIAPPWGAETRIPIPAGGFDNPYQGWPGGNPFPLVVDQNFKNAPFKAFFGPFLPLRGDIKMPTIQTWNLSIQRQVAKDWFVSTAYLGNQSYHLWQTKMLNESPFLGTGPCTLNDLDAQGNVISRSFPTCSTTGTINQRRRLFMQNPQEGKYIGPLDEFDDGGTSTYHGLQLSIQRRPTRGVSISGNYTWSHCLGDDARIVGNPNVNTTYKYTENREADRGNCINDRHHLLNFTSVAQTPDFGNKTLRMVASGWRLSGIYRYSTGAYLTITTSTDRRLNGTGTQRAQQILENPYGAKTPGNYLNPAAFTQPALGTYGNMGPRNVLGPSTWQFDTALSRTFRLKENQTLELRAEAFNVLNANRWGDPNLVINSNLFGTITTSTNTAGTTYDPRIMQFALKYVF